ncbi:MAG TPA: hypothetical protein PLS69_02530 [Terricaulis sp.]|nr:hypothetical protein [Terricaulis sp.]
MLLALVGFVGYRTMSFTAPPPPAAVAIPDTGAYAIDANAAAERLAQAIRFPTVSLVAESDDRAPFRDLHAWMQATYPAFHAAAKSERFGEFSLMYTWAGSDPAQPPMVLTAHMASATLEARVEMGEAVIVNIRTFMDGHQPPHRLLPEAPLPRAARA